MSKCLFCKGSGERMGLGMMMADCRQCDGNGYIKDVSANEPKKVVEKAGGKIDRRSSEYRAAIKKIMDSGVSREEAARVFDEEFEKLPR